MRVRRGASLDRVTAIGAAACAAMIAACASSIGNLNDPSTVHFRLGATRKTEVAEALGLPAIREVKEGYEYWGYQQEARLVAVLVPTATFDGASNRVTAHLDEIRVDGEQPVAYVYVFDESGVLVLARRRQ
jgi:hypothetical protein